MLARARLWVRQSALGSPDANAVPQEGLDDVLQARPSPSHEAKVAQSAAHGFCESWSCLLVRPSTRHATFRFNKAGTRYQVGRTTSSQRHDAAATWTAAFSSASAVPGPKGICPTIGPSAFRRIGSVVVLDDAFGQTVPNAELPCPILVL